MPELPEVETTLRGITPHIQGQVIEKLDIRQIKLRWPIPKSALNAVLPLKIQAVTRRAKYLLFHTPHGVIILHLGMSGHLRLVNHATPADKHDHIDFVLANALCLRFHDPRRFGCVLWTTTDPKQHRLLKHLGPEPLSDAFHAAYCYRLANKRKVSIKQFIMNQHCVVGVGNIYAQEALFAAGIHPKRSAGNISLLRYEKLVTEIKQVLTRAIAQGGTTLKDFLNVDGQRGYFSQALFVYGRAGEACLVCQDTLKNIRLGNRASVYCPTCQQ